MQCSFELFPCWEFRVALTCGLAVRRGRGGGAVLYTKQLLVCWLLTVDCHFDSLDFYG